MSPIQICRRPATALGRLLAVCLLPAALALAAPGVAAAAPNQFQLAGSIGLGAVTRWDLAVVDPRSGHAFIALGDHVAVVDTRNKTVLARIDGVDGAHGVAIDAQHQLGFIASGKTDAIVTFALDTFKVLRTTPAGGQNPDVLLYLPETGKLYSFNGKSRDMTVIDPLTGAVGARVALAGKPELAAGDADHIWVNLEDLHQLVQIDTHANVVQRSSDLKGCEEPTGLDYDRAAGRLFSACANGHLIVTASADGRVIAEVPIGKGPDGLQFDGERHLVLVPNGGSGTLTVIQQDDADHYRVVQTLATAAEARTIAYDPVSATAWLPAPGSAGFALIAATLQQP